MKKLDFNRGWICKCLTREETPVSVTLPHDAMICEPRSAESTGEGNIGWYVGGDYEYRKSFAVPEEYRDKKTVFEFEGVYHDAEVYIKGQKAAYHPYGYTNFYVEADRFLKYGEENEIRVTAKNSDQPNSRWYSGTGIYRPVWLYVGGEKHIPVNGVRIRTVSCRPAQIEVSVKTSVPGEVKIRILDNGMAINGEHVILRGACIHHDNGLLGACAFPEAEERKVRILKENGYNALQSSHYPCSKAQLDACDRLGMLMMDEYVDVWYMHKTKYDYALHLEEWWKQDLKDMVDKDYNHPSVIMYSTGNEVAETAQKKGIDLTGQFTRYLHEQDGTRPVTCGINIFFNFLSSIGMGVYSDDKAEKDAKAAEKKAAEAKQDAGAKKKKPVGSEFYNTLACLMGDYFMKCGATLPPCDWKTRDAYANMDIAGYNYGLFRYKKDLKKYPDRLILGSETFCKDAYKFYEIAKKHRRIIGDFVWAGWDYIVEVYARAAEVELRINGKSVGRKKLKNTCRAVFRTTYADGEVTAVSYDASGKQIGRYTLRTAGKDTLLRVGPEEKTVKPEGLSFVNLQYTDRNGIWKPMEKHELHVTVENGTLMGLGSANAYVEGNYTTDTTKTYYGEAQAVVRAGTEGKVRVTVSDEKNKVSVEIPVKA